ncbi:MAG: ABC transporter ATP-binding protein [Pseudomonadota bacterium]
MKGKRMFLQVSNLYKSFNGRQEDPTVVLEDVSMNVESGQLVSIVGPSGCGKTTLLEIIAGLQPGSGGEITVDGVPIDRTPTRTAIVFQQYALFPWLTVEKNIQYGPRIQGRSKAERSRRSTSYIKMVGLDGFENYYPHQLSGGMQQRVALARALANDPDILLLDEPFAALDAQTKERCQQELLWLWGETGLTMLFVTHDIGEALYLSDCVFLMSANPGTVKEKLPVDFSRPRDSRVRLDPGFRLKESLIRDFLNNGYCAETLCCDAPIKVGRSS